jgi:hypothetical protein
MISMDELGARLEGARPQGSGYKARCPAHDDRHASLVVSRGADGRVLMCCHAGCTVPDICSALGVKLSELFADEPKSRKRPTVGEMAAHKKLPGDFLRSLGLRDLADGGIGIPYRELDGQQVLLKHRVALSAKEGSRWPKGAPLMAYGLERLGDARELGLLVIVEGESDCWTLWHHGIPALGVPGASSAKVLESAHLSGIAKVFVIQEPDKGGDTFAQAVPARLKSIGYQGKVTLIHLDAKDPSELHCRDPQGFKPAFEAALAQGPEPVQTPFRFVHERLTNERVERLERARRIMPFQIRFLDEALGGIFPNDLILIGAASGEGKTALCTAIAHANARSGKRVHYFALEAEEREIERRMKYREISEMVFREDRYASLRGILNYIDWYSGAFDRELGDYGESRLDAVLSAQFATMKTFYKRGQFGVEELEALLGQIQDETECAIIDHLHYVDVDGEDENRGVKGIVMRVRDASLVYGKPIILVAHLRKKDRRGEALVPDLDDFHGSSDTAKVATKAIMIARAWDQNPPQSWLWPTYVYAPKCRMDGSRTRYCALVNFNARTQSYENSYVLGRLTANRDKFEGLPNKELPHWAVSALR